MRPQIEAVYVTQTFIYILIDACLSFDIVTLDFGDIGQHSSNINSSKFNKSLRYRKDEEYSVGTSLLNNDPYENINEVCRNLDNGTSIFLIYSRDCMKNGIVSQMLMSLHQPQIQIGSLCCPNQGQRSIEEDDVIPVCDVALLIQRLVILQQWEKLTIFYSIGHSHLLDDVMHALGEVNVTGVVYGVNDNAENDDVRHILDVTLRPAGYGYPYLVLGDLQFIDVVLNESFSLNLRTLDNKWVFFGDHISSEEFRNRLTNYDNMLLISKPRDYYSEESIQEITYVLSETYAAVSDFPGLVKHNASTGGCRPQYSQTTRAALSNISQELLDSLYLSDNETDLLIQSSFTGSDGIPKMVDVGRWTAYDELEGEDALFLNNFNGFNNQTFRIAALEYSFFQRKEYANDGSFKWVGLTFDILNELSRTLNFSYEIVEPPDMRWGIVDENGTWNGMIRMVQYKEVEFAASSFSITVDREMIVDFTSPYFHDRQVIVIKRPQGASKVMLFLKPFKWEVWLCLIGAVFTSAIVLWLVTYASPHYTSTVPKKKWSEDGLLSPSYTLWYMYGLMLQQGGVSLPESHSGRMIVGFTWFFAIVVVATYTGNLIASLAVSTIDMPFKSLSGMIKQSRYKWGTEEGVALVMLFRGSSIDPYKTIWDNMKQPGWMVNSYTEGYERVKTGTFAFIAEKSWYQEISATDCEIAMVPEEFFPTGYAWVFPKGHPHRQRFSDQINKMREAGLLKNWIKKWTPQNLFCKGLGPVTQAKMVELNHAQGGFYVLTFGVWTAIIIFLIEHVTHRFLSKGMTFKVRCPNFGLANRDKLPLHPY